jgi:hypothetical protein
MISTGVLERGRLHKCLSQDFQNLGYLVSKDSAHIMLRGLRYLRLSECVLLVVESCYRGIEGAMPVIVGCTVIRLL